MKISIAIADQTFTAVLDEGPAARDFASLLPLDVTLADYNRTEKVADLPRRLSTDGEPDGIDPALGDLAYYAPWGNLAIFYREFPFSRGLIRLGRIEGDIAALALIDGAPARIELLIP